jgi:tRNA-dihydrouridine synthase
MQYIPVTVKHRIGIDDMHSYEEMLHFVDTVAKRAAIILLYTHVLPCFRAFSERKP